MAHHTTNANSVQFPTVRGPLFVARRDPPPVNEAGGGMAAILSKLLGPLHLSFTNPAGVQGFFVKVPSLMLNSVSTSVAITSACQLANSRSRAAQRSLKLTAVQCGSYYGCISVHVTVELFNFGVSNEQFTLIYHSQCRTAGEIATCPSI